MVKGATVEVSNLTTKQEIDHILEERIQGQQGSQMDMDAYLENVGKSREELREEMRPTAQERLTRYLVIRKLAQGAGFEVSPEEIDAEIEKLASFSNESGDALRRAFSSENARSSISNAILSRKVLEHLGQIVRGVAVEEGPSPEDSAVETEEGPEATGPEATGGEEGAGEPASAEAEHPEDGGPEEEGGNPSDN